METIKEMKARFDEVNRKEREEERNRIQSKYEALSPLGKIIVDFVEELRIENYVEVDWEHIDYRNVIRSLEGYIEKEYTEKKHL